MVALLVLQTQRLFRVVVHQIRMFSDESYPGPEATGTGGCFAGVKYSIYPCRRGR